MMNIQNYVRPQSLEEAYTLNQNRRSRIIGGMLWLKMGRGTVSTAIDLCDLGLDTIEETQDQFSIGAMVTLRQLDVWMHPKPASGLILAPAWTKAARRSWDWGDTLLCAGFAAEIFLLLMHRTFGGWQFGARYLCDLAPMLLLFELRGRRRREGWETAIGSFAIAFNIYGAIVFHLIDQGK